MQRFSLGSKRASLFLGIAIGVITTIIVSVSLVVASYQFANAARPACSPSARNSPWAERARLPADSRQLAEEAVDHFKSSNFENAAADFRQIIARHPDCLYAWSNLGVVLYSSGDLIGARDALQKAVALSPDDAFSWANLGIALYELKDYDEAILGFEKALALDPSDSHNHNYLGCCYAQKGRQADAVREYRKALELSHRHFGDAYFNLALSLAVEKPRTWRKQRAPINAPWTWGLLATRGWNGFSQPQPTEINLFRRSKAPTKHA